jgi:hypothetical protein
VVANRFKDDGTAEGNWSYTLSRQLANNATGDNQQAEPLSRGRRLDSEIDEADNDLLDRVERAAPLPDPTIQLSNAAIPLSHPKLSHAAVQLSSPAIQIKLPFPFVGSNLPERFNYDGDHQYWDYMGREKFAELLRVVKELEVTELRGYLFYGTIGYGKSHLLAALACYLIADGKRVIYIPDCRPCAWSPLIYFRAAMLLAWGGPGDNVIRERIMALDTEEAIVEFFEKQSNLLFIIDQLNVLETDPDGRDGLSNDTRNKIFEWIWKCVVNHKYIFSASANNQTRSLMEDKQSNARRLLVYGGFSTVSLYTRCVKCRLLIIFSDGNATVVGSK